MKFIIHRTSGYYACEDLEKLNINLNKYNVSLESKTDRFGNKDKYAIIEINTLEDLIELNKDYGNIIIHKPDWVKGMREIEIYDTWRE